MKTWLLTLHGRRIPTRLPSGVDTFLQLKGFRFRVRAGLVSHKMPYNHPTTDTLDLRDSFDAKDLEVLAGIAGMASRVVEQARTYEERIGQEQVNRDLDLAKRVQQGLLPSKPPDVTGYQLFDFYEPAREIGGDFFDYIPLSGGRLAIVLADVSGKGVSAALVMMALSKDVRYCLASEEDLSTAVARINESFCKGGWDDRFATAIFLVLDPIAHKAKLVSAGHMPAYVRTPDGRLETHGDDTAGTPLGVVSQADQTDVIAANLSSSVSLNIFENASPCLLGRICRGQTHFLKPLHAVGTLILVHRLADAVGIEHNH